MGPSETALMRRARRAYELGRLGGALPYALLALPPALLSTWVCGASPRSASHGLALALLLLLYAWRGQELARAIRPGLSVGYVAFLLPWLAVSGGICPAGPSPNLLAVCAAAGFLAGLSLTWRCLERSCCSKRELFAAGSLAGLTASLGCAVAGFLGLAGMGLAFGFAIAPGLWMLRRA